MKGLIFEILRYFLIKKTFTRQGNSPWVGYSPIQPKQVCAAPKGRLFAPFGLKTGIDFAHFNMESGIWFSRELR